VPIALQATPNHLPGNRRYVARRPVRLDTVLSDSGAGIVIHDISATGLLIETSQHLSNGETLIIDLPERGATPATVAWSSGRYFGCEFDLSIPVATVSAALLRSPVLAEASRTSFQPDESVFHSSNEEAEYLIEDNRYPVGVRVAAILGLTGLSWAALGWAALSMM
jgi:hypothetical protein